MITAKNGCDKDRQNELEKKELIKRDLISEE